MCHVSYLKSGKLDGMIGAQQMDAPGERPGEIHRRKSWMSSQRSLTSMAKADKAGLLVDEIDVEEADWDAVRQRLKAEPDSAKVKGARGWLPLHAAASRKAPLDVVKTLLCAHAEGATANDESGHVAIHYAAARNAGAEVIRALAVKTFPPLGMPPSVVEAARCNLMPEMLALLAKNREGARETDNDNERLPLHFAVLYGASAEVIEALLDAYRDGAKKADRTHRLPIHHAARKSPKAVKLLLGAYRLSARKEDKRGRLPIHYACKSCRNPEVIEQLLTAFPASARKPDAEDGMPVTIPQSTLFLDWTRCFSQPWPGLFIPAYCVLLCHSVTGFLSTGLAGAERLQQSPRNTTMFLSKWSSYYCKHFRAQCGRKMSPSACCRCTTLLSRSRTKRKRALPRTMGMPTPKMNSFRTMAARTSGRLPSGRANSKKTRRPR